MTDDGLGFSDDPVDGGSSRMWPLDVALVSVAALILYIVFTQLRFDDPRLVHNAWTYAIAVPVVTLALAILLHNVVSQNVQKSIQLGFLTSVFVHLLLLLVAVRWVIFPAYFPEAFRGAKSQRNPIRKTVPEYVFEVTKQTPDTPDWAQPVTATSADRSTQRADTTQPDPGKRYTPPVPLADLQPESSQQPFVVPRDAPSEAQPDLQNDPSTPPRRSRDVAETPPVNASPTAPDLTPVSPSPVQADVTERSFADSKIPKRQDVAAMPMADIPLQPSDPVSVAAQRAVDTPAATRNSADLDMAMPRVAESVTTPRRSQRMRPDQPLGAVPSAPSVSIARLMNDQSRRLAPERSTAESGDRPSRSSDLSQTLPQLPGAVPGGPMVRQSEPLMAGPRRSDSLELPKVTDDGAASNRLATPVPRQPSTVEVAGSAVEVPNVSPKDPGEASSQSFAARDQINEPMNRRAPSTLAAPTGLPGPPMPAPAMLPGLPMPSPAMDASPMGGGLDQPLIASLETMRRPRRRVDSGGPIPPAGSQVQPVKPFDRRTQRTDSSAPPTAAGMVGPETEEAIERGLAFLAELQNENGSWSLQGHGEDVILRSDTAATGLCLLAFQGAGYTHKQHQYAGVVAKGLQFLRDVQRTNGDLYKSEDPVSNRNVALYSHGIAALALSEAFGMTQDPELREPAQMALDYIAATQHRRRGGWRYTPQVSADTSVTGWMMMALKSGELAGLEVNPDAYVGIRRWLGYARQDADREDRYRYDPFAPDTPAQRHGRFVTPTMTSVGILMRMYLGWSRNREEMKSAAEYLLQYPPQIGTPRSPQRDTYYWYYATQVMFHMGGDYWERWNRSLNPVLLSGQIKRGANAGSWDPNLPVADRWAPHAGRLYVTTMNLLNLEVYYRHLPIYDDTAK
ncbi:hypothetical protein [Crateriforma spongiae]|uniref:prenyltransferase/squalene oxidase repeat-containing protein n=1 Tax=Crateriforma spongiae TaxID=2724528 RepID=UPI0039AED229